MTAVYSAEEILEIIGGRLASGMIELEAGAICTDTRLLKEGDWFLALEGDTYDGHDFLGDAFANGAIGAIVAERTRYSIGSNTFPLIAVDEPSMAFSLLARNWRRRINPTVVILCGVDEELTKLIELISTAATGQDLGFACLNPCLQAQEAARLVLDMPETTKLVIVGLCPVAVTEVETAAIALEANVLAFLPLAFDNLRLTSTQKEWEEAKITLMRSLNKMWAWVLSIEPTDGQDQLMQERGSAALLACQEKFFEKEEWQKHSHQFSGSLKEGYEEALNVASSSLSLWQGWLCVTVCGLAGIAPAKLLEILRSN